MNSGTRKVLNKTALRQLRTLIEKSGRNPHFLISSPYGLRFLSEKGSRNPYKKMATQIIGWLRSSSVSKEKSANMQNWKKVMLAYHAACHDPREVITDKIVSELKSLCERSGYSPLQISNSGSAELFLRENFLERDIRDVIAVKKKTVERRELNSFRMAFCAAALYGKNSVVIADNDRHFFENYEITLSPNEIIELVGEFKAEASKNKHDEVAKMQKARALFTSYGLYKKELDKDIDSLKPETLVGEVVRVPFSTINAFKRV